MSMTLFVRMEATWLILVVPTDGDDNPFLFAATMTSSGIPQDIVDTIIDELKTDLHTLHQCSRVSIAFLTPSRRHLFAVVMVKSAAHCERFLSLLTSNLKIITLVKELYIMGRTTWAHMHVPFQSILRLFADHGSLNVFNFRRMLEPNLSALPAAPFPDSSAMRDLFRCPSLTTIEFATFPLCSFPFNILKGTPSLRHLAFIEARCHSAHCETIPFVVTETPSSPTASHLFTLDVRGHHSRVLMRYLWPSLGQLRILRTLISFGDAEGAMGMTDSELNPIDLRLLPELQLIIYESSSNLRLLPNPPLLIYEPANKSLDIVSTLRTSGLPGGIRCVVIAIWYNYSFALYDPRWQQDRHLADIFADRKAYPHLRDVYFIFVVQDDQTEPDAGEVEQCYPFMQQTGLLRCVLRKRGEAEQILTDLVMLL